MSVPDRITDFLGRRAGSGEPADVLGLSGPVTAAAVNNAKIDRLSEIDTHPHARTPAADDARLAVHVAAAVLLDRLAQAQSEPPQPESPQAAARPPQRTASPADSPTTLPTSTTPASNQPTNPKTTTPATTPSNQSKPQAPSPAIPDSWRRFAAAARPVLAHAGAIDRRTMGLLALLADRHGITIREIPLALDAARPPAVTIPPVSADYQAATRPIDDERVRATGNFRSATTVAIFALLAVALFAFAVKEIYPVSLETAAEKPPDEEPQAQLVDETEADTGPRPQGADALTKAAEIARSEPTEAAQLAAEGFADVSLEWITLDAADRDRAVQNFVAVASAAWTKSQRVELLREAILRNTNDPSATIAAVDVTLALEEATDIAPAGAEAVQQLALDLPGGRAERASALDALAIRYARLGENAPPIAPWVQANAFIYDAALPATRARLRAARAFLVEAPAVDETTDEASSESPTLEPTLTALLEGLAVLPNSAAGNWLLSLFKDPDITPADLHAVTRILSLTVPNAQTAGELVLARDAEAPERTRVRDNYARIVTPGRTGPDRALVDSWATVARSTLRNRPAPGTPQRLEHLVLLSRLNQAAASLDDKDLAGPIIANLSEPIDAAQTAAAANFDGDPFDSINGQQWAIEFNNVARSPTSARRKLEEANQLPQDLAPVAAELIVSAAIRNPDQQIRTIAESIVRRRSDSPVVINALLEELPTIPKILPNARLVEDVAREALPTIEDPTWRPAARAAIVSRLLEVLGEVGPAARTKAMTEALCASYAVRASQPDPTLDLTEAITLLTTELESRAATLVAPYDAVPPLEEIARRARGRTRIAKGLMQEFAARQTTAFELDAYAAAAEDASAGPAIKALLTRVANQRRAARDVLDQILAVEQAWTELWFIRYGERSSV